METSVGAGNREYSDTIEIPDIHQQQEEPLLSNHQDPIMVDLYPPIAPSRFTRFKQHLTKRNLKILIYTWRWPILFFACSLIMGFFMYTYRRQVFQGLETLSHKLSDMGYRGHVLMSTLIFLSAFPPIIGYGTFQTLSGYTFGFQIGFPISYISALTGAVVCFSLSRLFIKARVTRMLSKYPNLETVVKVVEKKGFKLFVLIRLSPYPFNLLNVLFAATDISLFHFAAGTAITLLKIALHVYIGANLTSFAKHILGEDGDMTQGQIRAEKVRTFAFTIGSFITLGVMAYIYRVAKAAVKEANATTVGGQEHFMTTRDEEQDIELSHGFLDDDDDIELESHHPTTKQQPLIVNEPIPNDNISLDAWDAWGDDDDDDEDFTPTSKKFKQFDALGKHD